MVFSLRDSASDIFPIVGHSFSPAVANTTLSRADDLPVGPASTAGATQEATFAEFCHAHFAFVWRNVHRLMGTDSAVDDVVQEVFLVAMRRLPEFQGRSSATTWLYGITRRVVRGHRRSISRRKQSPADLDRLADPNAHAALERTQALHLLHEILQKLDENKRDVFILSELEEMTASEISEALGVNESTVYARLRDARRDFELAAQRLRVKGDGGRT